MFEKGDYIIYGSTGVCLVEEVSAPEHLAALGLDKLYYRLSPVLGSETIYAPVDAPVFMRPIITKEQAEALVSRIPEIQIGGFEGKDRKETIENYKVSMGTHECEDLVKLIKSVYSKTRNLANSGKKPGQTDTQYLKQAETLLHSELSVALGVPLAEIPAYIAAKIQKSE